MTRIIADTGKAKQHWERRCDALPFLMVPMSDGTVIRYNPEIPPPAPALRESLDKFTELCIGYEWKGEETNESTV